MSLALHNFNAPRHIASEQSIRQEAAEIQASWSERERAKRADLGHLRLRQFVAMFVQCPGRADDKLRWGETG